VKRKDVHRSLCDRRHPILERQRLAKSLATDAAELESIRAQLDVLEMADMILGGHFDRCVEQSAMLGRLKGTVDRLIAAARGHENAVESAAAKEGA
jgi:hypothetical protein